jgi:hypothetical protein
MEDTSFFYDSNYNVIAQSSSNFNRAKHLVNKKYYDLLEQKREEKWRKEQQEIRMRKREPRNNIIPEIDWKSKHEELKTVGYACRENIMDLWDEDDD